MSDSNYDLKPSKEAYQAVKSDVTPVSAFNELVDNALDNWRRVLDGLDPVAIEIEYHDGGPDDEDEIIIRDDSGGVEEDDLDILFALGQSKKADIAGSIGAYGVGAKKAIVNLGNKATIRSRHMYADTGFGFSIDDEWMKDDDDWTVDKEEYEDIEAGVTEIRISDLNTPWEKYRDNLIEDLSETYQFYLDSDHMEDFEPVSIIVREFDTHGDISNTTEVEPPEAVDWSFTPMDGLFARRYEGIDIQSKEFDEEVTLNVTVGLMREASAEDAGADIYCQNRLVLSGVQDERAGFGMGKNASKLGNFSGQHRRLRVIIEFETDGDARVLPWDAQKSDIDPYTRVSRAARDWIGRIVRPYYLAAGAYDKIPTTLTRPYDRDCEHSVTDGLDDPYDYEGRERITHKPDTDFEDAQAIGKRADVTAALRVYSPDSLDDEFEPAYREEFLRILREEYDVELDEDETLPTPTIPAAEVPADIDVEQAHSIRSKLAQQAEEDAALDPPKRTVGYSDWKQTLYDALLQRELDPEVKLEDLETTEIGEDDEGTEDDGTPSSESTEDDETTSDETTEDDESTGDDENTPASDEDEVPEESGDAESEEDTSESSEESSDSDGSDGGTEQTGLLSGSDTSGSETVTDESDNDNDTPAGANGRELELTEEEWETLIEALGLDEDASTEDVRERLFQTMDTLRSLPA